MRDLTGENRIRIIILILREYIFKPHRPSYIGPSSSDRLLAGCISTGRPSEKAIPFVVVIAVIGAVESDTKSSWMVF